MTTAKREFRRKTDLELYRSLMINPMHLNADGYFVMGLEVSKCFGVTMPPSGIEVPARITGILNTRCNVRMVKLFLSCAATVVLGLSLQSNCQGVDASASRFSWQQPHAKVIPNGDLEWAPRAFVFEKGDSVRMVDKDGKISRRQTT